MIRTFATAGLENLLPDGVGVFACIPPSLLLLVVDAALSDDRTGGFATRLVSLISTSNASPLLSLMIFSTTYNVIELITAIVLILLIIMTRYAIHH